MSARDIRQSPGDELGARRSRPHPGRDIGWALAIKLLLLIVIAEFFFASADKPRMTPGVVAGHLLSPYNGSSP